ncbi:hypothetical protein [Micromonospora narathiwatensis]|uniref:Uncharacterized protein n=1 Tax=Micromonospora narathiwatensis TaxID=299146 RepID=A0A1A9AAR6_9ACTN|nr:hypothetical protein [Micromonospora narathiwatensis]SBT53230.1 hypothetical protein GA0070621_4718 [Micromonospora narathiwatensis]
MVYVDDKYHCTSGISALGVNGAEFMVGALSCGEARDTFVNPSGYAVNVPKRAAGSVPPSGSAKIWTHESARPSRSR